MEYRSITSVKHFCGIAIMVLLASVIMVSSSVVRAESDPTAPYERDASFNAFNANFLVQQDGKTYYNNKLNSVGTSNPAGWCEGLDIAVTEDEYERTHSPVTLQLINALLHSYETMDSTLWHGDTWNDDIGWMVNAYLRGYQITGDTDYLTIAEKNYSMAYKRGWDSTLGGGIYENMSNKGDKCCLSNNPFVWEGVGLYEATGDTTYLTDAEKVYGWVRTHLFNPTHTDNAVGVPGRLRQGERENGDLESGDNFYNSGSFLEAANAIYHVTKNPAYYNDAILAISHVMDAGPIMHTNDEGSGSQWAYWVFKGLSDFCTDNHLWAKYYPWMLGNADAAWSERNSANLTWNDWTSPTNDPNADAIVMSSAVAIWQLIRSPRQSLIINASDGMAMDMEGGNESDSGTIDIKRRSSDPSANQRWMLVPLASGNYALISGISDMAAGIAGDSKEIGASLVSEAFTLADPGEQFELVPMGKGKVEIKSVNSGFVLSRHTEGKTPGPDIIQSPAAHTAIQIWKIYPLNVVPGH